MKITWFLALALALSYQEAVEEDGVLVLTDLTVHQAIKSNPNLMIKFYAPWCGHCKQLAPEYSAAAKMLKSKGYVLAQVDATENPAISSEYNIHSYPAVYFFHNGIKVEYNGDRTKDGIINWIENKLNAQLYELGSEDEALLLTKKKGASIILVANPSDEVSLNKINEMMFTYDEFNFFVLKTKSSPSFLNGASLPAFVLAKKYDQKMLVYKGDTSVESIMKYMMLYSIPLFGELEPKFVKFARKLDKTTLILFTKDLKDDVRKEIIAAAKEMEDFKFIYTDYSSEHAQKYINNLGINDKAGDALFLYAEGFKTPYQMEGTIDTQSIKKFIADFQNKKIKKHIKSEPITESSGPVQKIVGKNFNSIVNDKKKDVLVKFYAPWCGHCKQFAPIYEGLARKLSKYSKELVIAEIDATANDIETEHISSFPTIKLYPRNNKSGVEFKGERNEESISAFLLENTSLLIDLDEVKTSL